MPWISKDEVAKQLAEARAEGREIGEKRAFEKLEMTRRDLDYRQQRNKEEIQLEWKKIHEEKRIFEEYKATEFLKMCREMNWNIGS